MARTKDAGEKLMRKTAPVVVIGEKPPPSKPRPVKIAISGRDANGVKQRIVFEHWGSDWSAISDAIATQLKQIGG